jgi:predicted PurR-regulated permease PerM
MLVGILVGAALYGIPGAFLAAPVAGALQVVLAYLLQTGDPAQAEVGAVRCARPTNWAGRSR